MEIPPELFTIGVPAVIGVSVVALMVLLVFWLGVGRQRSFEEAKAQASRRAEKVLQAEQHSSRKEKKKKLPFKKRREEQESLEAPPPDQPLKPILRSTGPKGTTPERKVGFQLEKTPPRDEEQTPRPPASPPTPYPTAKPKLFGSPLMEPMVEEATQPEESKPLPPIEPKPKPVALQKVSPPAQGSPKPRKTRQKAKQISDTFDKDEGLPASRISDILGASSLSDEDIQQLIQELFDKMNANAEWQAAARPESIKSLKKYNQDLQARVEEAERTVVAHSNKIKELRSEIQQERSRRQGVENTLQSKIAQHANDQQVSRTKVSGLEEELKQTKALSTPNALQQLREEYSTLQHQMATVAQQNSGLNSQLLAATKQVAELQDSNTALKGDLRRAREGLKSPQDSRQLMEKVKELEEENMELQRAMQASDEESARARAEMKALSTVRQERDSLALKVGDVEQQLQEAQDNIQSLEQLLQDAQEEAGARESLGELEAENTSLQAEMQAEIETLRKQDNESHTQEKQVEDMAALRAQLEATHVEEMARVRAQLVSEADSQREEEAQRVQEMVTRLEEAGREAGHLRAQLQKEQERASALDAQLAQTSTQLDDEQAGKKALQLELESLKIAPAPDHAPNGPLQENGAGEEKLPSVSLEVHREVVEEKEREKEELASQLKALEGKLDDLKTKNNTLRDNCWRAKDEAATATKECEQKLKQAYREAEGRCKGAKAEVLAEAQDAQKAFLQQLFPSISVEAEHFATWVDEFESRVVDTMQHSKTKLTALQSRVEELEKNEHTIVQEAEQLREALQTTMGMLGQLQSDVEDHNVKHQKSLEEREQMLERERTTNRGLQEQLRREKSSTAQLQEELQHVKQSDADEKKLEALEQRLQDSEDQQETAHKEVATLSHSLRQEQEAKSAVQRELDQLKERQCELEARVKGEAEEKDELARKSEKLQEEVQQLQGQLKAGAVGVEQPTANSDDPSVKNDIAIPGGSTSTEV